MPIPSSYIFIKPGYGENPNLAGNPIIAEMSIIGSSSLRYWIYKHDGSANANPYSILIYEGHVDTTAHGAEIDIAGLFSEKINTAGVNRYMISVLNTDEDYTPFAIYGGGISKLMMRQIAFTNQNGELEYDIFRKKLHNNEVNFFLTTRTNNTTIVIREDELLPVFFYKHNHTFSVKADGATLISYEDVFGTPDSLLNIDFKALRESYVTSANKLVSVFDIVTATGYICSILITEGEATNYFLKFKNSWGVWEKIALAADMDYMPEMGEAVKISKYDHFIADFVKKTERKGATNIYQATTGYKNSDDRLFILDMLHSSEVILIAHGKDYAVNVSTDTTLFASTKGEPGNVNLKIELIDVDTFFSPLIIEDEYETLATTTLEDVTTNEGSIILM